MKMIYIGISALTMLLIGIGIQLLEMKRISKIIFIGVWGAATLWFLIPFLNQTDFAIWRFIEVEKMNMIHMNISAVVMILVGIAIRFLAMNRLPKITFVIIWGACNHSAPYSFFYFNKIQCLESFLSTK